MSGPFKVLRSKAHGADLKRVELFRDLDDDELERLADRFVELAIGASRLVLQQGKPAEAFYIVVEGTVAVFRDAVGAPVQLLARLHRGDFFGELGLFVEGRHTASVRATEPVRVLQISKRDLLAFLDDHPPIFHKLQMAAARRHSANMASALEMGRRREVRIRCSHPVLLKLSDGSSHEVQLENLSLGGMCVAGAPSRWRVGDEVSLRLAIRENEVTLECRVAWRQEPSIGLMFIRRPPNHDMIIQMATRLLLELES